MLIIHMYMAFFGGLLLGALMPVVTYFFAKGGLETAVILVWGWVAAGVVLVLTLPLQIPIVTILAPAASGLLVALYLKRSMKA